MGFLTSRTIAPTVTTNDLVHIVITGDTSQGNPSGSSYKATIGQIGLAISTGNTITISGGTDISVTGSHPNFVISFTGTTSGDYLPLSGGTVSGTTEFTSGITANTISATTIGTSGNCVDDIYVYNIHSCSPLNINPLNEGNIYFGQTSGITIDVTNNRLGINTSTPSQRLHVSGNTLIDGSLTATTANTSTLVINTTPTTDPTNNNVLVRDVSTGVVKQRDITSTLNKNYASFYDTGDQTGLANTVLTMSANTSDSWNTGITLSANTRFVIQNPGVYSLAFSGQMVKTGGNTATHVHIWLYQNGLDVPNSASQIGFPANSIYVIPAWNFFFSTTTPNEYVELKWEINSNVDNQLLLKHQPATGNVPAIPSLIVTINQVN